MPTVREAKHHAAMIAIFVAWNNWCRKHETLAKKTPEMASGLADRVWSIKTLLTMAS